MTSMTKKPYQFIGLVLLFVLFFSGSGAPLIISETYGHLSLYQFLDRFGFSGETGQLSLQVSQVEGDVVFALCSHTQWQEVVTSPLDAQDIFCEIPDSDSLEPFSNTYVPRTSGFPCEIPLMDVRNSTLRDYKVKETDLYSMLFVHCNTNSPASITFTLELTNGDSQLPLGEVPLGDIYEGATILWSIILVWWLGMVFIYRNVHATPGDPTDQTLVRSNGLRIHLLFGMALALKMGVSVAFAAYWREYEGSGVPSHFLKALSTFLYSSSECFLFAVLLLVAKGWKITTESISPNEARAFSFTISFLMASLFFFSVYDDGYYFLSLVILYFFLVPKVFQSITLNSGMLRSYTIFFQNRRPLQTPALQATMTRLLSYFEVKTKMYNRLRIFVTWYLGMIIFTSFLRVVEKFYYEWMITGAQEIAAICIIFQICYCVRPSLAEDGLFTTSQEVFAETGINFPALFSGDGSLPLWDSSIEISSVNEEELNNELSDNAFIVSFPVNRTPTNLVDLPMALAVSPRCRELIQVTSV